MYFVGVSTPLMDEEAGGISSCDTCTPLKGNLSSSVRIEHIILGLRRCVTHRNRAAWGPFQDLEEGRLHDDRSSEGSLIVHSIVKFHIAAQVPAQWSLPLTPMLAPGLCCRKLWAAQATVRRPSVVWDVPQQSLWMLDLRMVRGRDNRDWRRDWQYLRGLSG